MTRLKQLVGYDNTILGEVDDAIDGLLAGGGDDFIVQVADGYVIKPDDPRRAQHPSPGIDVATIYLPTLGSDRATWWVKQSGENNLLVDSTRAGTVIADDSYAGSVRIEHGVNDEFGLQVRQSTINYTIDPGVYDTPMDALDATNGDDGHRLRNWARPYEAGGYDKRVMLVLDDITVTDGTANLIPGANDALASLGFTSTFNFTGQGFTNIDDQALIALRQWESVILQWDGTTWIRWASFGYHIEWPDVDPHVAGALWVNGAVVTVSGG